MVIGPLPVVGVPLPLMSDGGTSMASLPAGFGLLMSIHTHRKLLSCEIASRGDPAPRHARHCTMTVPFMRSPWIAHW